jgi:2-polyprenyl-6-methoxyphenol hydroxylase-like FAD-dependent oxidoreductase
VVDRAEGSSSTSRAAVVHAGTLEVLDRIAVAAPLVNRGIQASRFTVRDGDRTLVPVRFDTLPTRFPYALMIPQSDTEAVLSDRLTALGGRVLRPYPVVDLAAGGTGGVVTFAGGETVGARYVVGADGMNSAVRRLAGIAFGGADPGESFFLADVRIESTHPRDEVVVFLSRSGMLVWAPLPDGIVRIVAAVDEAPERPGVGYVQSLVDARGSAAGRSTVSEVVWGSRFRVHHRVADTFRAGPVLLAGDAGHVHSPAGGQGMNLGLQDAVALGGALASVLAGEPEWGLDQYVAARRPVAREVVEFTGRLTRLATVPTALRPARNAALRLLAAVPAFRQRLAWQLSGLIYR